MKGIVFKSWKIKAIAESSPDREWQTRRTSGLKEINQDPSSWNFCSTVVRIIPPVKMGDCLFQHADGHCAAIRPRYHVGEVVYLKEAHYAYGHWEYVFDDHDDPEAKTHWEFQRDKDTVIHFAVSEWQHALTKQSAKEGWYKRSPLFLPEEAARYFIKITGVEACRTRDISFKDCLAEGVVDSPFWQNLDYKAPPPLHPDNLSNAEADKEIDRGWIAYAQQAYYALYDSINGEGAHEHNWDFAYRFKKTDRPSVIK